MNKGMKDSLSSTLYGRNPRDKAVFSESYFGVSFVGTRNKEYVYEICKVK